MSSISVSNIDQIRTLAADFVKSNHLRQAQIAKLADVPKSTISEIASSKKLPSCMVADRILRYAAGYTQITIA